MPEVSAGGVRIGDGHSTKLLGVLNLSPESQHHDSTHAAVSDAVSHVEETLVPAGADIVEIGLRSTSSRGDITAAAERDRLAAALEVIDDVDADADADADVDADADADVSYCIETRHAPVAAAALDDGFDMVNDVCGFADPAMPAVCADRAAPVVKMASGPDIDNPGEIHGLEDALRALVRGGRTDRTIVDPGFGGWCDEKTLADDRHRFRHLPAFRRLGHPVMVALDRKEFITDLARERGRTEPDADMSPAAVAVAVTLGADLVRTHDVPNTRAAAAIADAATADAVDEDEAAERADELVDEFRDDRGIDRWDEDDVDEFEMWTAEKFR